MNGAEMHRRWGGPGPWGRVLVYGLGVSGASAARLLLETGVAVAAVDRRSPAELALGELEGAAGFELLSGGEPQGAEAERQAARVDAAVLSPGVPPDRPLLAALRRAGKPVISEAELALPWIRGPVAAITGTNGKSTTTELAGAMVRASGRPVEVCGNIGRPVTERARLAGDHTFVIELSSFQLEAMPTFRPQAAAFLNLAPDHLDRYPDLAAYGAAKAALFANQGSEDQAVVNADDPMVLELTARARARRRLFSRTGAVVDGCWLEGETVVEAVPGGPPRRLFERRQLPLAGAHNVENAMAAALLALALGCEPKHVQAAMEGFRGLPHRMERVGEIEGVVFYDDSKGTNVAATVKSLEDLPAGTVHLILGGLPKGDDPTPLRSLVATKARRLYLIGAAAEGLAAALAGSAEIERSGTLEVAVRSAAGRARPGEVVLLSPACASFDQFTSYAHRGDRFQQLVRDLAGESHG